MKRLSLTRKLALGAFAAGTLVLPLIAGFLTQGNGGTAFAQDREYLPIARAAPVYPHEAARARLEGEVILEFTVTEDGTVRDLMVIRSSDAIFEQPALEAAAQFRYQPRIVDGRPVDVPGVRNLFRFVLEAPATEAE
jgi:periplasmic protein TonB